MFHAKPCACGCLRYVLTFCFGEAVDAQGEDEYGNRSGCTSHVCDGTKPKHIVGDTWCSVHAYLNTPLCFVLQFTVPVVKELPNSDC